MTTADEYRVKATEFSAQARFKATAAYRAELELLAQCYRDLAALADRNRHTNVVQKTPPHDRSTPKVP